jgi:hypothetical protein
MLDHTLRVGEELVIHGHVRLTVLTVDEDKVFLGITAEPNGEQDPLIGPLRLRLTAAPVLLPNRVGIQPSHGRAPIPCEAFSDMP